MTTARTPSPTSPAHLVIAGRTVCGGTSAPLPSGDAPPCRACGRTRYGKRLVTA